MFNEKLNTEFMCLKRLMMGINFHEMYGYMLFTESPKVITTT